MQAVATRRARGPGGGRGPARLHAVVMSEQQLTRDAIHYALGNHGLDVTSMATPVTTAQFQDARRWSFQTRPDVGVLVSDLVGMPQLRDAIAVINKLDLDWIVLTNARPGAAWGALIDAGAADVMPASTQLDALVQALTSVVEAVPPLADAARENSIRTWRQLGRSQRLVAHQLASLSPREMDILVELENGAGVKQIADRAGLSEGTVRSQVKSILHKLDVTSQLQAVATYRRAEEWFSDQWVPAESTTARTRPQRPGTGNVIEGGFPAAGQGT